MKVSNLVVKFDEFGAVEVAKEESRSATGHDLN
jgi:hypothetical protein